MGDRTGSSPVGRTRGRAEPKGSARRVSAVSREREGGLRGAGGEAILPEISRFYGIVIKMYFKPKEHEPSHIHALYGEYMGEINIRTMEMDVGDLPRKALELVTEWLAAHQDELQEMWDEQRIWKLPPLE